MTDPAAAHVLKPQPRLTEVTRPYWEGANEGRLMIQRCANPACGKAVFYPRVCCPYCRGGELTWFRATGRGTIVTHTTVRRPHHGGFNASAPYVFAAVEIEEGACIYAEIPGAPVEGASLVGRQVMVVFAEHGPGRRMPVFRLQD
jgi:uncharacterized OB-fold protein